MVSNMEQDSKRASSKKMVVLKVILIVAVLAVLITLLVLSAGGKGTWVVEQPARGAAKMVQVEVPISQGSAAVVQVSGAVKSLRPRDEC